MKTTGREARSASVSGQAGGTPPGSLHQPFFAGAAAFWAK